MAFLALLTDELRGDLLLVVASLYSLKFINTFCCDETFCFEFSYFSDTGFSSDVGIW